jgi:type IV pilus assembly protein PilB
LHLTSLKKRLGDILVDVGIITPEQLKEALDTQKITGEKLGTILAQKGMINEEVMLAFLGKQCGVSYISLNEFGEIPSPVLRSLPLSVIRHQTLIPVSLENNTITVAMSDPFNVFAVDDIKLMTGYEVQIVIASESEIKSAIEKYYSKPSAAEPVFTGENVPATADQLLNAVLAEAVRNNSSDVHIGPLEDSLRIRFRIDGILHEQPLLPKNLLEPLAVKLKTLTGTAYANEKNVPCFGKIKVKCDGADIDIVVNIMPSILGDNINLKFLGCGSHALDINKLGFETETLAAYKKHIGSKSGMIVITGPVNSGKTTTIYSTLNYLNQPDRNIVSVEELVHCVIPGVMQVQLDNSRGLDFRSALSQVSRHSPDILVVDEVRNPETARLSIDASLNGQLVFASLSMDDTISAAFYLSNMGLEPFVTSSALIMVMAQRLMRLICPACRESYKVPSKTLLGVGFENAQPGQDTVELWRGRGCPSCNFTGYSGRIAIYEILEINEKLRSLMLKKAGESEFREAAVTNGFITLRKAAWRKVKAGVSTAEEMLRITK